MNQLRDKEKLGKFAYTHNRKKEEPVTVHVSYGGFKLVRNVLRPRIFRLTDRVTIISSVRRRNKWINDLFIFSFH